MNIKMTANSQLSTTESKKTKKTKNKLSKQPHRNRIIAMEIIWRVISWGGERGRAGKKVQGLKSIICRDKIDRRRLRIV